MKVPFLGGAYKGRSTNTAAQECVNLYYEPPAKGEQHDGALVGTPGASLFADLTELDIFSGVAADTFYCRGGFVFFDGNTDFDKSNAPGVERVFFCVRNTVLEYVYDRATPFWGPFNSASVLPVASNRVTMAANNIGQVVLAEGSVGVWLKGGAWREIDDENYIPSEIVVHQDGYFIQTEPGSNRFRYSALLDATTWPADNFVTAEGSSDTVESLVSDRRELWVFGAHTSEIYYNSGDSDQPWQRFQRGFVEMGIAAKHTAKKFDNTIVWLGQNERGNAQVVKAGQGWAPVVISTPEIAYRIEQMSRIDDAFAYTYQHEGHEFYVITFPSANETYAYDALTQEWHQRAHPVDDEFPSRERFGAHAFWRNQNLVCDFRNGLIYSMDSDLGYLETASSTISIPRVRTSPSMFAENERRVRVSEFQLDMEEGVNDADVYLSYSKNGGHTFSTERARGVGGLGKYAWRVIWRKLGVARNWIFRIRTFSDGKVIIKGAWARLYGEDG